MPNSNHKVSLKRKITVIIFGAMLALTGAMPASATVSNTVGQNLTGEQQSTQLLAKKGQGKAVEEEPSKGDKNPQKGESSKGQQNPKKGESSKGQQNPQKGESSKGQQNPKKGEPIKGGHSTEKTPSKQEKHQKGEARRLQDQVVNRERKEHKDYQKRGGKLGFDAWKREGQPRR